MGLPWAIGPLVMWAIQRRVLLYQWKISEVGVVFPLVGNGGRGTSSIVVARPDNGIIGKTEYLLFNRMEQHLQRAARKVRSAHRTYKKCVSGKKVPAFV